MAFFLGLTSKIEFEQDWSFGYVLYYGCAEVLESDFEIDFCRNRFWNLNSKSDVKREIEIEVENKNRDRNRNRLPNEIEIEVGFEKEIEIEIEIDLQTKSRSKSKLRKEMALLLRF